MTGESSSIDIGHLIEHLSEKVLPTSNPSSLSTSCIFRVDKRLRKLNEDAYTPDTLSIGPYHRDVVEKNLQMQEMEDLKKRYVKALLDRTRETASLKSYVEALKELETDPNTAPSKSYSEPINNLNNKEENFLEMMLIDGLFIIELFRKQSHVVEVDNDDPIFRKGDGPDSNLRRSRIERDLVLLENQIPMSVLKKLFELSQSDSDFSLIQLALIFFKNLIPDGLTTYRENTPKHLLDLLSGTFAPPEQKSSTEALKQLESLPCATELWRSGINFKGSGYHNNLLNMKFSKGKFEIPTLRVDDHTDCFFRNLIAYEQQSFGVRQHMTSYALLMDHLIDTARDVTLLRDSGIIMNHLGDNEKVSSLFNSLCREISTVDEKFCYGTLCTNLIEYHRQPCHWWKAYFRRKYCSSPWACIALVAAILALLLALFSTVLAALSFFGVKDFIYILDNGQ